MSSIHKKTLIFLSLEGNVLQEIPLIQEIEKKTIIFLSPAGNFLEIFGESVIVGQSFKDSSTLEYTLEYINKDITWGDILSFIKQEEWYRTYKRWSFVLDHKILKHDDIIEFDDDVILITCINVVPQITFVLSSGEFLVSIPFDICETSYSSHVSFYNLHLRAHIKLKELGKDGYKTDKTKIHSFFCNSKTRKLGGINQKDPYLFHKNGKLLDLHDDLEDPGNEDLIIVATPNELYCDYCCDIESFDRIDRGIYYETIRLCPDCGFLHCPYCGMYGIYKVGTSGCHT